MSVVCSGKVSNTLAGTQLTFTDTGTGYGTIVSRNLGIYDSNGTLLTTINMGVSLTTTYAITADGAFKFVLVVIDNTGTYTCTVNYLAENIYFAAFLQKLVQSGCGTDCSLKDNIDRAEWYTSAAERYLVAGLLPQAQTAITNANVLINANT